MAVGRRYEQIVPCHTARAQVGCCFGKRNMSFKKKKRASLLGNLKMNGI